MARRSRHIVPALVYHVYNRGNLKEPVFAGDGDRDDFLELLQQACARVPMRILAYCLMTTHWHLVVWPDDPRSLSRFMHWLCTMHSMRYRRRTGTTGLGHVYQDRFKTRVVSCELGYLALLRYVEANALAAGLVMRAEDWRWSSLHERVADTFTLVENGPVALPLDWIEFVNQLPLD